METAEKRAFLEHFADLEDPRTRESPHTLAKMLVAVCAVVERGGRMGGRGVVGRTKLSWLGRFLPFVNGVASHETSNIKMQ